MSVKFTLILYFHTYAHTYTPPPVMALRLTLFWHATPPSFKPGPHCALETHSVISYSVWNSSDVVSINLSIYLSIYISIKDGFYRRFQRWCGELWPGVQQTTGNEVETRKHFFNNFKNSFFKIFFENSWSKFLVWHLFFKGVIFKEKSLIQTNIQFCFWK